MSQEPLRLLDTSVLIRYLTNDVPSSAERARRSIDSDRPLGITTVALLEAYAFDERFARSGLRVVEIPV